MNKFIEIATLICLIISNVVLLCRVHCLEREMINHYHLEEKIQNDIGDIFSGKKQFKGRNINAYGGPRDFM